MKKTAYVIGGWLGILAIAGWIQHVHTCLEDDRLAMLIGGTIVAPVGIVHGWGIWLGLW